MSLSQQVRNALRQIGGPANASQITEQLEDETESGEVSKLLFALEKRGFVAVNRDARPFTYTLVTERADAVDEPRKKKAQKAGQAKPAAKEKPAPKSRRGRPRKSDKAASKPKRKYTRRQPAAAAEPPRGRSAPSTVTLASDQVRRLCVLAINPVEALDAADRRLIADCLLQAA
jgi:hypothetical protein